MFIKNNYKLYNSKILRDKDKGINFMKFIPYRILYFPDAAMNLSETFFQLIIFQIALT